MSSMPPSSPKQTGKFSGAALRFIRSPYVIIALLIHFLLLLIFGGKVIFQALKPKGNFEGKVYVATPGTPPPPPPAQPPPPDETIPVPTQTVPTQNNVIANDVLSPDSFKMPDVAVSIPTPDLTQIVKSPSPKTSTDNFAKRADGIRGMTMAWGKDGESGPTGTGRATEAQFVCYLARATGINPASYHTLNPDGSIKGGPIPNLMRMINAWSSGRINASMTPKPLDLSSQDLFTVKPPFIYFAGFNDFTLSDLEVANLHKYLIQGGAIWGDNGLAGKGSPFDIAFRREMKRVIPDEDKPFEVLPPDHPIFQGNQAFFQLSQVPPGMNYRDDPVEAIKIDGEIAVIYTLNDYTDMMCMGFANPIEQAQNKIESKAAPEIYWMTPRMRYTLLANKDLYFRNFEAASCEDSFRLGINIVVHLLTRFQERLASPL